MVQVTPPTWSSRTRWAATKVKGLTWARSVVLGATDSVNADDVIIEDPVGGDEGGVDLGNTGEPQEDWIYKDWVVSPMICACVTMVNLQMPLYTFQQGLTTSESFVISGIMIAETNPLMTSPDVPLALARGGQPPASLSGANQIPIPGTLALLPLGLAAGAFVRRRRR